MTAEERNRKPISLGMALRFANNARMSRKFQISVMKRITISITRRWINARYKDKEVTGLGLFGSGHGIR